MGRFRKFFVAALGGALSAVLAVLAEEPEGAGIVSAVTALLVYGVPNKKG